MPCNHAATRVFKPSSFGMTPSIYNLPCRVYVFDIAPLVGEQLVRCVVWAVKVINLESHGLARLVHASYSRI